MFAGEKPKLHEVNITVSGFMNQEKVTLIQIMQ